MSIPSFSLDVQYGDVTKTYTIKGKYINNAGNICLIPEVVLHSFLTAKAHIDDLVEKYGKPS